MTMQSKVSKAVFNGNGATTDFPFDFRVWDTSELSVTITGRTVHPCRPQAGRQR